MEGEKLYCVFCGEGSNDNPEFDLLGLQNHLRSYCDVYGTLIECQNCHMGFSPTERENNTCNNCATISRGVTSPDNSDEDNTN